MCCAKEERENDDDDDDDDNGGDDDDDDDDDDNIYPTRDVTALTEIIGCLHVMSSKVASRPFSFPSRQTLSEQFNET